MKSLFARFLPLLLCAWICGAHAGDVVLGAGDVLKMSVFGSPDLTQDAKISDAGHITFPLIGEVVLAGLTTYAAEKKIAGLLDSGGFVRKPQVNVVLVQLQSQQVSVLGQIVRPGRYPLDGKRSLIDIIALAGGASAEGGDVVTLIRTQGGQSKKQLIDFFEMIRSGNMLQNLELVNDDVVFIERAPKLYVYGEVQRPGSYRLERNMTVLQTLSASGGLTARGTERGLRIKRRNAEGQQSLLNVKLDDPVQGDDVIYVQESLF